MGRSFLERINNFAQRFGIFAPLKNLFFFRSLTLSTKKICMIKCVFSSKKDDFHFVIIQFELIYYHEFHVTDSLL